jgi:hypothetical protein
MEENRSGRGMRAGNRVFDHTRMGRLFFNFVPDQNVAKAVS